MTLEAAKENKQHNNNHCFHKRFHKKLFKLVDFRTRKKKTAETVIFKIGFTCIRYRLAIFGFFAGALYVPEKPVWMYTFLHHRIPCFGYGRQVILFIKVAVIDSPGHAINK